MATTRTANTIGKAICWRERAPFSLSSSNIGTYDVSWPARSEEPGGKTSPEELIAAAHFSRYSMAFAHGLAGKGYTVASLDTKADITFQPGEGITTITLTVHASVPGLSDPNPRVTQ